MTVHPASSTPGSHAQEVLAWRRARVARLTAEDSWLSLIGKHYLEPGAAILGSHPDAHIARPAGRAPSQVGRCVLADGEGRFEPARGVTVLLRARGGKAEPYALSGPVLLKSDAAGEPDQLLLGTLSFEIME